MIKILNKVSDSLLEEIVLKHDRLIDLDAAAVKCGYCNNLKYRSFLAFVSHGYQGYETQINALSDGKEITVRIAHTSMNAGNIRGFTTTVRYHAEGLVLFNMDRKEIYILSPEQEVDFIALFKRHRGIEFYQSAVKNDNDYIVLADIEDYVGLKKYL